MMKHKIMHFLFLSCLKATELIEKKFNLKLSFKEKIQLELHKMMCDACRTYEKQSRILEESFKTLHHSPISPEISEELLKKQIHSRLKEASK